MTRGAGRIEALDLVRDVFVAHLEFEECHVVEPLDELATEEQLEALGDS